jgi:YHS domain-containing protein
LGYFGAAVGLAFIASALLAGCQKEQPKQKGQTPAQEQKHASADQPQVEAAIVQTTCPVMGGAIDKAIFTEYKGKKVYFCCKGCIETFKANPEKYIAKLPQFAK